MGHLKNGFDQATNQNLSIQEDVDALVGCVVEQLARLPVVRGPEF
jgi:hypothetical protein